MINFFKNKNFLVITGIILLSIFFRFFLLESVPPGLYPDVAMNGMDAVRANETGDYKIFYPANNGREGLFMNLDAFVFKAFGTGLWQLRFAGAVIGVLTVLGIYLLGKEMFNRRVGMFAALFMSTSFWAVNFSRIGFRAVMVPLILVWGSYFLLKAFREGSPAVILASERRPESKVSKKGIDSGPSFAMLRAGKQARMTRYGSFLYYVLAGLVFGLGFHTYIAYKAAVLIFAVVFGYKIFLEKGYFKKSWIKVGVFGISLALLALPILYYQQTHKEDAARTGQVSVFNPAVNKGNLVKTLAITSAKGLGMYNFYGDPNSRHNFKSLPALNPLVGIAFLIGFYLSVKTFLSKIRVRDAEFFNFSFLIFSFFIMMIPSVLTEEGMPHSLRAIGTMPFAFIFAGIGTDFLLKRFNLKLFFEQNDSGVEKSEVSSSSRDNLRDSNNKALLVPAILGLIILFDFFLYFQVWAKSPETRGQFNEGYVEASNYLNTLPKSMKKYVIVNGGGVPVEGLPVAAQTFKFVTYGKSDVEYISEEKVKDFKANFEKDSIVILAKHDDRLINLLDISCPNGGFFTYNPGEPNEFYAYKIPKTATSCGNN